MAPFDEVFTSLVRKELPILERVLDGNTSNLRDKGGMTVLMLAICTDNPSLQIARLLLDRGADVSAADPKGFTALHLAARDQQTEIVQLLLERGANVHAQEAWGNTPLARWFSTRNRKLEVGKLLMRYGSDPNVTNVAGISVLQLAKSQWDEEAAAVLENRPPLHANRPEFWRTEPEEAGRPEERTTFATASRHRAIKYLHFEFVGWQGDCMVAGGGQYLVLTKVAKQLKKMAATGADIREVQLSKSPQFAESFTKELPAFAWLVPTGTAGKDDFGLAADGQLVISRQILDLLHLYNRQLHGKFRRYAFD